MSHEWNVGVLVGRSSWHGLESTRGELFAEGSGNRFDLIESMSKHDAFYNVEKLPIGVYTSSGEIIPMGDDYAIIRPPALGYPKHELFQTVKNRYNPIQNFDLANIGQGLINAGMPFRGWAILSDGRVTFIQLDLPEFTVKGIESEHHTSHLLLANDHSAGSATWKETNVRTVCRNTYNLAVEDGIGTIPHGKNLLLELDYLNQVQLAFLRKQDAERTILERLFDQRIFPEDVTNVLETVFPYPVEPRKLAVKKAGDAVGITDHEFIPVIDKVESAYVNACQRQDKVRDAVRDAFGQFNADHSYAGETAYALFQSVTNVTNHWEGWTGSPAKGLVSLHLGNRSKINDSARSALINLCEAK